MLSVSRQAILKEPRCQSSVMRGDQCGDEDEARGAPRTDGRRNRIRERANERLLDPFLRAGASLDCSYEVYRG